MARPAMTRPVVRPSTKLDRSRTSAMNAGVSSDSLRRSTCINPSALVVGSGSTKQRRDGKNLLMPRRIRL